MYSEWASLTPQIQSSINSAPSQSVLNKFGGIAGRDVVTSIVKQLASNLGITSPAEPSNLNTDQEVLWCMDVICHGLSLPLNEHETIKDCVNIYCKWLTALDPIPKICVPKPVCDDPNVYARKVISHFYNLFVPRNGEDWAFLYQEDLGNETIHRQALLCHQVLRTLQETALKSSKMTLETWESLLLFLLAINEILLAPPIIKDDIGDQLCDRVLSVLFEVWALACVQCFPSPSLWKTFQESCASWRHRIQLIEQWNRINLALTAKLLEFTYGPTFPELKIPQEDVTLIPVGITNDGIAQSWFRFLKVIGNPTDLCCPQVISRTSQFMQYVLSREDTMEPHYHPCLLALPQIFLKAMKGIASQVDAFLGIYQYRMEDPSGVSDHLDSSKQSFTSNTAASSSFRHSGGEIKRGLTISAGGGEAASAAFSSNNSHSHSTSGVGGSSSISTSSSSDTKSANSGNNDLPSSPTPPLQRRLAKSFSVAPSHGSKGLSKTSFSGLTSSKSSSNQQATTPNSGPPSSSSLNSMLSLSQENRVPLAPTRPRCNSILHLFGEWLFEAAHIGGETWILNTKKKAAEINRRPSSIMENRKGSLSISQPASLSELGDVPPGLAIDKYESGKAEALGALCRIFCAKKTGEEILPVYLARFYVALQQGLKVNDTRECEESMASILYNSSDLFRVDLEGIQVLLPAFIAALELVLPEKDLRMKSQNVIINKTELRRASIHILLSLLVVPLHFQALPIRDLTGGPMDKMITFVQLKPRLINILMNALQVENDAQNTHMLLGGLLLCVQDSVAYEENEVSDVLHTTPPSSDINLLSSACSEKSAYSIASAASANSSLGGNSTATLSNEPSSLPISDDFAEIGHDLDMSAIVYDSAHALFVRATYLVCHRLISSWKTDLNVSLAALELLSGLASLHIKDSDALECKRAVKWICDYICYQCSRPPPAHSKDLHSTIVAAFQCTSAWLMHHPYLLQDKECLTTVLEVVELGISGSKSVGKAGEPVKLKDEKELKPASMRVRDAAESLLTLILEQIDYFPSECGKQSLSSLLDEVVLAKHCNSCPDSEDRILTQEQAVRKFKYFVTENSTVLALLEEPLGNDQDPQPTVTLLIRGPFGRHAWTMQLRHLPRSKSGSKYHAANPGRPVPMNDIMMRQEIDYKYFPDSVDRIPPCVADYSIPTLDAVEQKIGNHSTKTLSKLVEDQLMLEKLAWAETECSPDGLGHTQEASAPNVCHEFQAARLFLSHFGFLTISEDNNPQKLEASGPQLLTVLDTSKTEFCGDLTHLDKMSPRTCDTIHIFYVKAGQSTEQEIIGNMELENMASIDPHFWTMLLTLGEAVSIDEHAGWTGFINTSWKIPKDMKTKPSPNSSFNTSNLEERRFNGEKRVLYWADVSAEMAFVVPTIFNKLGVDYSDGGCLSTNETAESGVVFERSVSDAHAGKLSQKPRTLSLDFDTKVSSKMEPIPPVRRRTGASKPNSYYAAPSAKIFLVWLESFEDHLTFPIEALLAYTKAGFQAGCSANFSPSDCHVIFLHALNSSLLRVKLQGPPGRMSFAIPLVDGMVVSKRVIGSLVRQTAHNMANRRRLDIDSYQPPHVRRRLKVQEMVQKYKLEMTEPELLAHLFKNIL